MTTIERTPRDLPSCPKVRVYKDPVSELWTWNHECGWRGHSWHGAQLATQEIALRNALHHARHCEAI